MPCCLLAQSGMPTLLFLAGLAIIIFFLLRNSSRQIQRTRRSSRSSEPIVNSSRAVDEHLERQRAKGHRQTAISDHASKVEVELQERGRELLGQLDSKMIALQHLVSDADRAANRVEAALETLERFADSLEKVEKPVREEATESAPSAASNLSSAVDALKELEASIQQSIGVGTSPRAAAADASEFEASQFEPFTPSSTNADEGASKEGATVDPSSDERYQEIYLLSDYGFEPLEIASRTGLPIGQVQLILGLRESR